MQKPLFSKGMVKSDDLYHDIGKRPERPFSLLATTLQTTLGDLIAKGLFFVTLKNQFDFATLHVWYRDVRPYSRQIMSLFPDIDRLDVVRWELPGGSAAN